MHTSRVSSVISSKRAPDGAAYVVFAAAAARGENFVSRLGRLGSGLGRLELVLGHRVGEDARDGDGRADGALRRRTRCAAAVFEQGWGEGGRLAVARACVVIGVPKRRTEKRMRMTRLIVLPTACVIGWTASSV